MNGANAPEGAEAPYRKTWGPAAWTPAFWLGLGNLNNRGNAGLWYVNANNRLGNGNWNIASRVSGQRLIPRYIIPLRLPAPELPGAGMPRQLTKIADDHRASRKRKFGQAPERYRQMKTYCRNASIGTGEVYDAFLNYTGSGSGKKHARELADEHGDAAALASDIAREIVGRTLEFSPIVHRNRYDPLSHKMRHVGEQSPKQQLADYVADEMLAPMFEARYGRYQCASIKGRGQVYAKRAIERWCRESASKWFVKLDIRKCYESIDHALVMRLLRKYVGSEDVLYLAERLLETYEHGLNIGSFFSMRVANWVLSFAYHEMEDGCVKKRRGRSVRLIRHQLWYMDDVLLIGSSKKDLKMAVRHLKAYLRDELGLQIKPWKVCKVGAEPIDMCGYVMAPGRTTIRPRIFLRATRAFAKLRKRATVRRARRCASYWGFIVNSDSFKLIRRRRLHSAMSICRNLIRRASIERSTA